MSKKIKDGGTAFPICHWQGDIHAGHTLGLTKRDWYAGMALQGYIVANLSMDYDGIAKQAFEFADAMIQQSEEKGR